VSETSASSSRVIGYGLCWRTEQAAHQKSWWSAPLATAAAATAQLIGVRNARRLVTGDTLMPIGQKTTQD
jgi:hypothetical protein